MLRLLIGGLSRRVRGEARDRVTHEALEHAHWDRELRAWLNHETQANEEVTPAA